MMNNNLKRNDEMTRINPARRLLSLLCVFAMAITMVVVAPAQMAYGAITSPILEISSPQDFKNFADTVNNPDTCDDYVGQTVVLTKDIDLSKDPDTADWTDIVPGIYKDYAFRGTFDGQGHTISGLYVNRTELLPQIYYPYTQSSSYSPAALFGFIGQGAVLRNFIVQGEVTSTIGTAAGVAAGLSSTGIIEYVGNEVNVTSGPDNGAAGISVPSSTSTYDERAGVFTMYGGTVRYCYNTGTITGGTNSSATNILSNYGAGIYGYMRGGTLTGNINYGDVSASAHAGGIVGGGSGASYGVTIINCINFGEITRIGNSTGLQCGAILGDVGTVTSSANNFYYKYKTDIFGFGAANGGSSEGVRWIAKTDTELQDSQFVTDYNDVRIGTDPKTAIVEGDTWPVLAWAAAAKPIGAPVITAQPNDVWKVAPDAASLSVTFALPVGSKDAASGAITKVEWYSNSTESNVGGALLETDDNSSAGFGAGGTSTYAIPTTTVGSYYYYCVITNAWGTSDSAVVVSRPVRLFVTDPANAPTTPVITTNPDNLVLLEFSTGNTLSVAVDNTSYNGVLTYQWYANSDASNVGGSKIKFATDATYEPPTSALGTINYYCVATNTTDGISTAIATSDFAAVRVHGIEVSTAAELLAIQQAVANGKNYAGLHIELIADIDLSTNLIAAAWEPIGRDSSYPFNGLFLGHGKTISGLNIINYEGPYAGLFGYVGSGAVIQDLVVKGNITDDGSTYNAIGGVVGYIAGTSAAPVVLSNIGSEVNVDSSSNSYNLTVGGLVGAINTYGSIANSYHRGNVAGSYRVGGLAGSIVANAASLNLSYNQGSVQLNSNVSDSDAAVGGLAGYTTRGLLNSYNTATVSAPSGSKIGALVGYGADTAQPGTTGSSNDYYLAGVSGTPDVDFLTNSVAKTDAELKDAAFITAINAGTSAFVAGDNGGYPKLSWEGVVSTTVDSSLLQAKLSEASTIQLDVKVSDDGTDIDPAFEWVSQTVVDALQKVVTEAGLAFNDPNPTQAQIDAALVRLSDAVVAYNAAKQQGTLFIPVNPVDEDWRQLAGGGRYSTMKSIILDSVHPKGREKGAHQR
ncbi:hypothetical protein FACS1894104_1800 [Actinomycetota bacterium]|nr:hypothetical protein FACS1894104_1800 [Actinomycetota bacterium]